MPFNSYLFIFAYLPITVAGFWLLLSCVSRNGALVWLTLASMVFYIRAGLEGSVLIAADILFNYLLYASIARMHSSHGKLRTILLYVAILANVLFLGYFKYNHFLVDTLGTLLPTTFGLGSIALPLGLSFMTFQNIAFLLDIYTGQPRSVRFLDFLLFSLFFPRAVAGPIVHYCEVVPQLPNIMSRSAIDNVAVGCGLFSIGLFKKTVIAGYLAALVPSTFDRPGDLSGAPLTLLTAWEGVLAYLLQLYFDFSGYSDMALGVARMFGIRLPMNFNSPLKASSMIEFWSRWHITLTQFLTTYIYTPVALCLTRARMAEGKSMLRGRHSSFSAIMALVGLPTLITMSISGLWHGAGWQFLVWGLLHGIYLTTNQTWRLLRPRFWPNHESHERVMKPLGFLLTFFAVATAIVFFRARSVGSALSILDSMIGANGILPFNIQLLHRLGVSLPWSVIQLFQPIVGFVCMAVLFIVVMLMPNSLEVLGRFQPALDFPGEVCESSRYPAADQAAILRPSCRRSALVQILWLARSAWHSRYDGFNLNRITATILALSGLLGVMAIARSGMFIYGQF
jgi:alginate O-acetyltransferase complex protein AlgI